MSSTGALAAWVGALPRRAQLMTCPITELGFVRVLSQVPQFGLTVAQARDVLARIKTSEIIQFSFLDDSRDASRLPSWVKSPKQITDGHLVELATSAGLLLATLDQGIPDAFVIPKV